MLRCLLPGYLLVLLSASPFLAQVVHNGRGPSSLEPNPVLTAPIALTGSISPGPSADPEADGRKLAEANRLSQRGEFEAAMEAYDLILERHPQSSEAYAGLARVYLRQEDVKQAFEVATKGVRLTDGPAAHAALGEVYFRQGRIAEAEQELMSVIKRGAPLARAYWGLSRVRTAQSLDRQAKDLLDKAHELDSEDPDIKKSWIRTQTREEQIRLWKNYLASPANDDAETRASLQHDLDFLLATRKQPSHSCRLVSPVQDSEIKLLALTDKGSLRGYGLAVSLNGTEGSLLLDTGTHGIVIGRKLAERAGIAKISETSFLGGGDESSSGGYFGFAKSIAIGGLDYQDCRVRVTDQDLVLKDEGVVGMDMFGAFLVKADFPMQELSLQPLPLQPSDDTSQSTRTPAGDEWTLDDEPEPDNVDAHSQQKPSLSAERVPRDRYIAPEMRSFTPIYHFGHLLMIPTKIGDQPPQLFILDTGSSRSPVSSTAAGVEIDVFNSSRTHAQGMNGSVTKILDAGDVSLQFAGLNEENKNVFAFDLSHLSGQVGTEISGLLGINLLRDLEVRIDYRDGLIDFKQKK